MRSDTHDDIWAVLIYRNFPFYVASTKHMPQRLYTVELERPLKNENAFEE